MDAKQTSLLITIGIAFILLALFFVFFVVTLIRNQKQKQRLYQAKIIAEIATLEKERSRVAADLHDELGPLLVGVKFNISALELPDPGDAELVDKAHANIDNMMRRMREIARDLLPQVLYRKGLAAAMHDFIDHVAAGTDLAITFDMQASELPPERNIHLFRILQEIVHNTIKHAQASALTISIKGDANLLQVLTRDNGKGFDYDPHDTTFTGFGLRNLLSRTEVLNGTMFVDAAPGKGTAYQFDIPF